MRATRQLDRSPSSVTVVCQSSSPAWNCRLCTMTAIPTSSNHRSGVVSRRPSASWSSGLAMTSRRSRDDLTRTARSASGIDQAPAAASARSARSIPRPFGRRASIQCATSSSRTSRRRTASTTRARAGADGMVAAVSTRALDRHEKRKGDRSMIRSSVTCVRRMDTQPMSRGDSGAGTRTWTRRPWDGSTRPCSSAAVGPESHDRGPAYRSAATRRWSSVGSAGPRRTTPGRRMRHERPTDQRIWSTVTPSSTSWDRRITPSCS